MTCFYLCTLKCMSVWLTISFLLLVVVNVVSFVNHINKLLWTRILADAYNKCRWHVPVQRVHSNIVYTCYVYVYVVWEFIFYSLEEINLATLFVLFFFYGIKYLCRLNGLIDNVQCNTLLRRKSGRVIKKNKLQGCLNRFAKKWVFEA